MFCQTFFNLQAIDQLRKNMILGLEKDANFKFEKDWEFFTNMFKKQVADNFSSLKAVSMKILFPGSQLDSCGEVGAFEHFRC